jgi:transcriptional regulator GlxA family with amidase domain
MDRSGSRAPAAEVAILIYPQCYAAMVQGMTDLMQVASDFSVGRGGRPLRLTHWGIDGAGAIGRVFDTHPGTGRHPDVVIAPALALDRIPGPVDVATAAPFTTWLAERHAEGTTLASTGCGTFVLAAAGVLAGRPATTHWRYADTLRQSFPDVRVDADKVLIEDGDILTAGGMMAWTDLGMCLIDRLLGPTVMMDAAQFWLIDPAGREQRHYSTFVPRLTHSDQPILRVQHRLQSDPAHAVTVADMAGEAAMETRTFLRRFKAATGMTPIAYLQQLRIGKARELLQFTRQPVEQVAWTVGYGDSAAFRRVFQRLVGLSPSDYRRRFGASREGPAG